MSLRLPFYVTLLFIIASSQTNADILTDNCTAIGDLARNIMEKRQSGTDMSAMMSVVEKLADENPIKGIGKTIVIMAYEMPLFSLDENKRQTISEFANQVQVKCYQGASAP